MKKKIFALLGISLILGLIPFSLLTNEKSKESVIAASIDGYSYKESKNWIDLDVPFENHNLTLSGGQKLGEGAYQLSFQGGWGKRMYSVNEYDATNISISLNVSKLRIGNPLIMTFLPYDLRADYVTNSNKYFHMEVLLTGTNQYMIVLGDHTCNHNISTAGFKLDNYAAYEGRKINNVTDGNVYIKINTDYETNKFNLNVNNGKISYSCNSDIMFKGSYPKDRIGAYLNMSVLGDTEIKHDVIFSEIYSPDIKEKTYINAQSYSLPNFYYECKMRNISEITIDGDKVDEEIVEFKDKYFTFKAKFLNTLSVGTHKISIRYTKDNVRKSYNWNLNVYSNLLPKIPSTSNNMLEKQKGDIAPLIIDIDINGAHPSEITFTKNGLDMTESDYKFLDYNTKIEFSSFFFSSLNLGPNVIRVNRNNINGTLDIIITIIEEKI